MFFHLGDKDDPFFWVSEGHLPHEGLMTASGEKGREVEWGRESQRYLLASVAFSNSCSFKYSIFQSAIF